MSNRSTRRFTPHEENYAVSAFLADSWGAEQGRPYLAIEARNGREYWTICQLGRNKIRTGIRLRDAMLASIELRQARWAWGCGRKPEVSEASGTPTLH